MDLNRSKRPSLKSYHPNWKEKLRENCLRRVQEQRTCMLWKFRSAGEHTPNEKGVMDSMFKSIVSDELKKIRQLPLKGHNISSPSSFGDVWEYDDLHEATEGCDREELLIEMQQLLYEDWREESIRRELDAYEEEDEYLAQAVLQHMQLSDGQVEKDDRIWCPICKRGVLGESHRLIYCSRCKLRLDLENDKVNLEYLRDRLGEVHMEHLDKGCKATPTFCMETVFDLTALYIRCQACKTFEVVL